MRRELDGIGLHLGLPFLCHKLGSTETGDPLNHALQVGPLFGAIFVAIVVFVIYASRGR